MGVLKSIRKRNQGMGRRISNKKLLNYSSISNGSGDTQDDSVEMLEATTPLFERDIRTSSSIVTSRPDQAAGPEYSPRLSALPEKETEEPLVPSQKQREEQLRQHKRTPVEPIGPLGVVVNEDDWDSISHISGISTRTESSTPKSSPGKSMNSTDIQKDLAKMEMSPEAPNINAAQNTSAYSARTSTVVSPGPKDKNEVIRNTSNDSSEEQAIIRTLAGARVEIVVIDSSDSKAQHTDRIVRILKRFDNPNKDGNESESGCNISHVFEDDQESTGNNATPIYSQQLPTPALVSPEKTPRVTSSFVAVFDSDLKEKQHVPPSITGTAAPSFDGSTATVNTNNTTTKSNICDALNTRANTKTTPESFTDTIHEKLNAIEVTMRSSCTGGPEFLEASPSCDSFLSSPSAISENLKDSFQQIKKELNSLYVYSGLESAATRAEQQVDIIQCPQSLFSTKAEPKEEQKPEEDIPNATQESFFCTEGSKTVDSKATKESSLFSEGSKTEESSTIKSNEKHAGNDNIYFTRTETQVSF